MVHTVSAESLTVRGHRRWFLRPLADFIKEQSGEKVLDNADTDNKFVWPLIDVKRNDQAKKGIQMHIHLFIKKAKIPCPYIVQ